ncbi:hypothetical protein EYC80_005132 [Monilinia laxa]|uniref:Uncharacterized protein n=1 Tax=Monilinia laxa TaxID=61186 RepID=A0A5N6KJJ0_MONLA|nr:hypothetical protein EYC80_005132 [Monilinia laxa]
MSRKLAVGTNSQGGNLKKNSIVTTFRCKQQNKAIQSFALCFQTANPKLGECRYHLAHSCPSPVVRVCVFHTSLCFMPKKR